MIECWITGEKDFESEYDNLVIDHIKMVHPGKLYQKIDNKYVLI